MDERDPHEGLDEQHDVVVVGGGAAGLAGAVALARMRRSVLVVDAGAPRNAPAEGVHNHLGREGTPPRELVALGRAEAERYGARVVEGRVASLARTGEEGGELRFAVALEDGRTTTARRLLLATGAVDELPGVPGLAELWGTGVLHCPYCHGWEVRGAGVAVLSTGPMTAHGAGLWRQVTEDLVVLAHTGPAVPPEQAAVLAARGVRTVEGEVVAVEARPGGGVLVRLASGEVLERDALVAASTVRVDERLTAPLGVAVDPVEVMGHVVGTAVRVDATGGTTAPGVWAAGNAASPMAVLTSAAAAGVQAGAAVNGDLVREDGEAALAALGATAPAGPEGADAEQDLAAAAAAAGAGR